MKVLIIHQHFNAPESGGPLRSYFLAKALIETGHQVQVLTGSKSGKYFQNNLEGIEVHYLPVEYANRFGFWRRVISFLKFVLGCIRASGKFRSVDWCYAISVPLTVGLAARWLKWRYNIKYLFEVGDLWPDAAIELDVIQNRWLKNFLWRMEKQIYKHAYAIVALSPAIRDAIQKKIPNKTVHVIPNMADCQYFNLEKKQAALEKKYQVDGQFVISYFGAMGFANGLEHLLACAKACQREKLNIRFILTGDGAERENLIEKSKALQINNVSFQSFQNREGIAELMNVTDAVFVSYRQASILETGSPNKFFDGLAAGKIILINFGGWIKKEIEEAKCGFYIDPERPEEIVPQLAALLASHQQTEYKRRSRQLAEQKFSREKLMEQWVRIFQRDN